MKKLLIAILLMAGVAWPQEPAFRWVEFHPPLYPTIARSAHIEGKVIIEFTILPDGTVTVQKSTGHPILVAAALDSLKQSKAKCDGCGDNAVMSSIGFDFRITGEGCYHTAKPSNPETLDNAKISPAPSEGSVTSVPLNTITITAELSCICCSKVVRIKSRSIRCLYLWKCAWRRQD
jgi:TonB family protein